MSYFLDLFFLSYFVALNGSYALLIALAGLEILRRRATRMPEWNRAILNEPSTPPIAILTPAFNEARTILDALRSFQQLDYPNLQILVINDGSEDETLTLLTERLNLKPMDLSARRRLDTRPVRGVWVSESDPRILVVDKENGGKADALNVGLDYARAPLVCCLDADTVIERQALLRMVEPFLFDPDRVLAVGGTVRIANGCVLRDGQVLEVRVPKSWLARFQIVEYLRAFLFGRMGMNLLGGPLIISGAFGLFSREALIEAGGYVRGSVGEDMELIVRLHRVMRESKRPYRVVHIPDPVCFTEAPERIAVLGAQRDRWQRGLVDTLRLHRALFLDPAYGLTGLVVFPMFLLFELLGPLVELAGFAWFGVSLAIGQYDPVVMVLFFFVAFVLGFLLSMQALILDDLNYRFFRGARQRLQLFLAAVLELFGYRQITLYYRLKGMVRYLTGSGGWSATPRKGFENSRTDPAVREAP
jgi:cellulose synthase/poly-beta-1,6-N-acetylglucosamine synthase-like glycosyltransferase